MGGLLAAALVAGFGIGLTMLLRKKGVVEQFLQQYWRRVQAGNDPQAVLLELAGDYFDPYTVADHLVTVGSPGRGLIMDRVTADGRVTPHWGHDIMAELGTEVKAAKAGIVLNIVPVCGYGNIVQIAHLDEDISTVYAHLQWATVGIGQLVAGGEVIGRVGATTHCPSGDGPDWAPGQAAHMSPHLHFEVHPRRIPNFGVRTRRLDPIAWLATEGIAAVGRRST